MPNLAEMVLALLRNAKEPMIPGLEAAGMERLATPELPTIAGRDSLLQDLGPRFPQTPLHGLPGDQFPLPGINPGGWDPHESQIPSKDLGRSEGIDAALHDLELAGKTSYDISGQRPKRQILQEPPPTRPGGADYPDVLPEPPGDPHLQEFEKFQASPDQGVYKEPDLLLNTPVLQSLREMTTLPRRTDARLGKVGDMLSRQLGQSGLPDEELVNANDLLQRFMSRVRTPLDLGGEGGDAEAGLGVKQALEIMKDVRNRLNPNKMGTLGEDLSDQLRMQQAPPQQRAREAVDVLEGAAALRPGGELSDYTGESKPGYLLDTMRFPQRKERAQEVKSILDYRSSKGLPMPSDRRNEQFQRNPIRNWAPKEEVVNPEALSGLRPGATDDPFENVLSGQQRSALVPMQKLQELGLKQGGPVVLRSGDGRVILATVEAIRLAPQEDAQAIGLRQGIAPPTMRQHLDLAWQREGPQYEVIFKPRDASRPGLESSQVTDPLLALGKKAATEATSGVGKARPYPELGLSPEQAAQYRAAGYGPAMDATSLPRGRATGAPYLLQHPTDPDKALIVYGPEQLARMRDAGWNTSPSRAKALGAAERGPQEITGAANIKKALRQQTAADFRNQPRDVTKLGESGMTGVDPNYDITQDPLDEMRRKAVRFQTVPEESQPLAQKYASIYKDRVKEMIASKPEKLGVEARTQSGRGSVASDRRDMESRPTSTSQEVSDPETAINLLRGGAPKGSFYVTEHYDAKYPGRTYFNAQKSDVTLAIAKDFGSAGEQLTKRAAGGKYVPVQFEHLENQQALNRTAAAINKITKGAKDKGIILNIAGNSLSTFLRGGAKTSQTEINAKVLAFVKAIAEHPGRDYEIKGIVSGGQTGLDEAGAMAGKALGIPTSVNMPNKFTMREPTTGMDIWTDRETQKARFAGQDVSERLAEKGRAGAQKLQEWKAKNPQGGR